MILVLGGTAEARELAVQAGGNVEDVHLVLNQLDELQRLGQMQAVGVDLVETSVRSTDQIEAVLPAKSFASLIVPAS